MILQDYEFSVPLFIIFRSASLEFRIAGIWGECRSATVCWLCACGQEYKQTWREVIVSAQALSLKYVLEQSKDIELDCVSVKLGDREIGWP